MSELGQSPVRVGFVMHKMQVAGAEVLVKQLIERLRDRIEPTVLCLDSVGELGHQLIEAGVSVVSLNRKPGIDWSVAKSLAVEATRRQIEVLHAHQYTPFFYSAIARLKHRLSSRILFTEHGRPYPDVVSWKRRLANRLCLQRYADVTTACCDFSTHALQTLDGFPRALTLPNGIELSEFLPRGTADDVRRRRQKLGLEADGLYVACVARMHPIKDHETLIRGWKHVQKALPTATLLLVGDGPQRGAIEQQIADAKLTSSVRLLGVRHDVREILGAVNVSTLTSKSEAASLTLLESMACECPAVVTDVGGNSEHLRDGVDGFLVPRGDDHSLAQRLIELLANKSLQREFGNAARQHVASRFLLSDAASAYAEYFQALSGRLASNASITRALADAP